MRDPGGALLDSMTALLGALDPPRHGVVPTRDFLLVLALAGYTGDSRRGQRDLEALLDRYRVDEPPGEVGMRPGSSHGRARELGPAVSTAAEAAARAGCAAAAAGGDVGAAWPVNYERFLVDARLARLEGLDEAAVPPVGLVPRERRAFHCINFPKIENGSSTEQCEDRRGTHVLW